MLILDGDDLIFPFIQNCDNRCCLKQMEFRKNTSETVFATGDIDLQILEITEGESA